MINKISVNTQSSIRIQDEKVIYCDPFQIEAASHDADLIFITHPHYDHFSPESIQKVMKAETQFICPESMKKDLLDFGVDSEHLTTVVPGDQLAVDDIPVEVIAAYNTKKPFHPKDSNWVGYILTISGQRILIAGDTNYIPEHETVSCDIALVPIGGYYTMDAREAAHCINTIQPKAVIPTHFGSIVGYPKDGEIFAKCVTAPIQVCFKLKN